MSPATDVTDLRAGAPLHDRLLALLPLVGVWHGRGAGIVQSSGEQFAFTQQVTFAHDGRPFLAYESRSWLVDDSGVVIRAAFREQGFWRPGDGEDDVEVTLASAAGLVEVLTGTAGDADWQLASAFVLGTPTARAVGAERRFYAVRGDVLSYATELALPGAEPGPHLNAALNRVPPG